MENSVLVSILIPTYNRKELVQRAIESALKQTYKNIEIIVFDNFSSDGTVEHLKEIYKDEVKIKIFQNVSNVGPVNNWISCINNSSGDYAKLLFSDDEISTNYIEKSVNILKKNSDIGLVFSPAVIETNSRKRLFYKTYSKSKKVLSSNIENRFLIDLNVPVSPGAAFFRKEDLKKSIKLSIPNKENKDFRTYGAGIDLNIYFEILKKYKFIYFSNETKNFFYGHDASFTISNNLDFYYQTVRLNYLRTRKMFVLKKIIIGFIIKSKFTKILNYCSPYLN
jgi:glycosyltransferase involved in cell wall biosynthesis